MRTSRISDFKLAEYLLRLYCSHFDCTFVDVPVVFKPEAMGDLEGGILFVSNKGKLSKTLFQIVAGYLKNLEKMGGKKLPDELLASLYNLSVAIIYDFVHSDKSFPDAYGALPAQLSLNREPFVWLLLRGVICPAYSKALTNIKVVALKSDMLDTAKLFEKEEVSKGVDGKTGRPFVSEIDTEFIALNMEVESYPARLAFLLFEAMRGHGLDSKQVARDLLLKDEVSEKLLGMLKIAMMEPEDVKDFIFCFAMLAELQDAETQQLMQKTAQFGGGGERGGDAADMGGRGSGGASSHSSFWQMGLIEKMLEPDRGMHWDVYFRMKPFTERLKEKIEEAKLDRGLKELPLELLLRVQSDKYKNDPELTLQGLLADNRVW